MGIGLSISRSIVEAHGARTMGSSRVRIYRLAGLKVGSGGQTYRQGCNRPLRVQKAGRHHGTLVIARPSRLLPLSDQDAYTGPTIMSQSRRGSRAQGHQAYILGGGGVPCLEVVAHEL